MKNKLFIVLLIAGIGCAFLASSCVTPGITIPTTSQVSYTNEGEFGKQVMIPAMNFESRGLVFTETTFSITPNGSINGSIFTYQQLLKEAQRLGADAIINVVIDKKIENQSSGVTISITETWYGSALAIKYTEALKSTVVINGGMVTKEEYYFNGEAGSSESPGSNGGTGGLDVEAAAKAATTAGDAAGGLFDRMRQNMR